MAKPTIAQLREKAVKQLAERKNENYTDADLEEARHLMNRYYRLCGLDEQLLYLANEEATCDLKSTKDKEEQAIRWCEKLNEDFKPFHVHLEYFGYCPTICAEGTTRDLGLAFFYN